MPYPDHSDKQTARIAGLLYFLLILCGFFYLRYVPTKLIVWDNASLTTSNIIASETFFRLGMAVAFTGYILFLCLPFVLYKLLSPVNKSHATFMVVFAAVSVPISLVNMISQFDILTLISKANYVASLDPDFIQTQVMLKMRSYSAGNKIASIFWGLWLFPFGYLVFKSGFLPKILGILLMFGCFGYVFNFLGSFLLPDYNQMWISDYITKPGSLGELGICLWLLIMGVKTQEEVS